MAKEKILVVDDEEDLLRLLRYNLVNNGYQTDCVTTGEEALKRRVLSRPTLSFSIL